MSGRGLSTEIDRRDFLKATGFSLAALGLGSILTQNTAVAQEDEMPLSRIDTDVLVIGGGYAGVFAAVEAKNAGLDVVLVDKGMVGRSGQTPWANGFNVYDESQGDDRDSMIEQVAISSEYVNNPDWLELQFEESKTCWDQLTEWGIHDPDVNHPHFAMRDKLVDSDVRLVERTMLTDLLMDGNTVVGAIGFTLDDEETVAVVAKSTILAAGAGGFKAWGFPIRGLTSDGDAMAYRAGAAISGKEWNDFHSTSLETPADCWNQWQGMWEAGVSQTHGASGGGMLLSSAISTHTGESTSGGMGGGPPGGDSGDMGGPPSGGTEGGPPDGGPPDGGDSGGMMGAAPGGESDGGGMAPGMSRGTQIGGAATGLGIHKAEGVWPTDMTGASGVTGLWAAGDGLASMLCGASYAGVGLSSSGSAVQGAVAGEAAAAYASKASTPNMSDATLEEYRSAVLEPRNRESGISPSWLTQAMQSTMLPYYVLHVKKQDRLEAALTQITFLREHMVPMLVATDSHDLKLAHEVTNMLINAEMKLRASLFRTESRGTHYREDIPARDDENWLAWVLIEEGEDGTMTLRKEEIPDKWKPDLTVDYQTRYTSRFPGELAYLGLE